MQEVYCFSSRLYGLRNYRKKLNELLETASSTLGAVEKIRNEPESLTPEDLKDKLERLKTARQTEKSAWSDWNRACEAAKWEDYIQGCNATK